MMNPGKFIAAIRNPDTRWESIKALVAAVAIASLSISGTMAGSQLATGFYQVILERFQFPMILAEIESMRLDALATPCEQSALLRGQIATWNQRIAHEQESNQHVYSDWASTDRWLAVARIHISCNPDQSGKGNSVE